MKRLILMLASATLPWLGAAPATAIDLYPWNDHAKPNSFLFGNDIDLYQQSQRLGDGDLSGFFYISFTGVVTKDGYRVAAHVDCGATTSCTVGWTLSGQRRTATFWYEPMSDHPVFLVDRVDIPEPGAYAHFHWLGGMPGASRSTEGYLLQLLAVDTFCFIPNATAGARTDRTCRDNGGIAVIRGIDIATHLNIVTSAQ